VTIRKYRASDEDAVYEICLRTGRDGGDASELYRDPKLVGHVFAGPYIRLEPDFAWMLDPEDGRPPVGYVLGALDTRVFEERCEREWWPALRARYPDPPGVPERTPDQERMHNIHHPWPARPEVIKEYPSHLHIDLLPEAQGGGNGRRLIDTLQTALAGAGSPGVHLGVSTSNENAVGFYLRLGFHEVARGPGSLVLGRHLRQS
jgi:ribosomal protein S18 acetylase RimI-like enzyme